MSQTSRLCSHISQMSLSLGPLSNVDKKGREERRGGRGTLRSRVQSRPMCTKYQPAGHEMGGGGGGKGGEEKRRDWTGHILHTISIFFCKRIVKRGERKEGREKKRRLSAIASPFHTIFVGRIMPPRTRKIKERKKGEEKGVPGCQACMEVCSTTPLLTVSGVRGGRGRKGKSLCAL